MANSFMFPN